MGEWTKSECCDVCADCGENLNEGEDVYVSNDGETYCEGCGEEVSESDDEGDSYYEDDLIDGVDDRRESCEFTSVGFADPGGNSALRAETSDNPRNLPCPNCKRENMLTPLDVAAKYQCNICADECEKGY